MGYGGNMASTISLEYLFDAARSRPDIYIPLLQERFEALQDSLIEARSEAANLRTDLYDARDKLQRMESAVETIKLVSQKIIAGAKHEL